VGSVIEGPFQKKEDEEPLTFARLTEANLSRCIRWHGAHGVQDPSWSVADWSNAMAGEAGEVCNEVKKLKRLETGMQQHGNVPGSRMAAVKKIGKEIGDTALYLNLLAARLGLRMEDCIRYAFNQVSEREGFPERL
jgi:NTP pyrophosphatase (non-canonical NTP hydrolase)